MFFKDTLSVVSGVLFLIGFVPYIRAILNGPTKPPKASWVIWASMDSITLSGMMIRHSVNGQIIGAVIGAWTVVILSLKYGEPGWDKRSKVYLIVAAMLVPLTFIRATLGIIASSAVVMVGGFKTFEHAYDKPEEEDRLAWTIYWVSCVLAIIAVPAWDWDHATQPVTFAIIETIVMWLLWVPRDSYPRETREEIIRRRSWWEDPHKLADKLDEYNIKD